MKTIFTTILFFAWMFTFSQSDKFKAQIFTEDTLLVSGGVVIFPLTNDTLKVGNSDTAIVDLNKASNRVFYFLWSGWKSKIFRFEGKNTSTDIQKVCVPDTIFYRRFEKTKICPICLHSKNVIQIKYGMPTKKMFGQAEKGKFRLGGCEVDIDSPKLYCRLDDFEF